MIRRYFPEEIEYKDEIIQKWNTFVALSNKVVQPTDDNNENNAQQADLLSGNLLSPSSSNALSEDTITNFRTAHESLELSIQKALDHELDETEEAQNQVRSTFVFITNTFIISVIASVAIAVTFAIFVANRLSQPIVDLKNATKQIVAGNFNFPIRTKHSTNDEIGDLSTQLDRMRQTINQRTGDLKQMTNW